MPDSSGNSTLVHSGDGPPHRGAFVKSERVPRLANLGSSSTKIFQSKTPRFAAPTISSLQRYRKEGDPGFSISETQRSARSACHQPLSQRSARSACHQPLSQRSARSTCQKPLSQRSTRYSLTGSYRPLSSRSCQATPTPRSNSGGTRAQKERTTSGGDSGLSSSDRLCLGSTPERNVSTEFPKWVYRNRTSQQLRRASTSSLSGVPQNFSAESLQGSFKPNPACIKARSVTVDRYRREEPAYHFSAESEHIRPLNNDNDAWPCKRDMNLCNKDDADEVGSLGATPEAFSPVAIPMTSHSTALFEGDIQSTVKTKYLLGREKTSAVGISNTLCVNSVGTQTEPYSRSSNWGPDMGFHDFNGSDTSPLLISRHGSCNQYTHNLGALNSHLVSRHSTAVDDCASSVSSLSAFACSISSSPSRRSVSSSLQWERVSGPDDLNQLVTEPRSFQRTEQWSLKWIHEKHPELLDNAPLDTKRNVYRHKYETTKCVCVSIPSERNEQESPARKDSLLRRAADQETCGSAEDSQGQHHQDATVFPSLSLTRTKIVEILPVARALTPRIPNAGIIDPRVPWMSHYLCPHSAAENTRTNAARASYNEGPTFIECPDVVECATSAMRRILLFGTQAIARLAL